MAAMPDPTPAAASPQISREDVAHLAGQARIQLDDAELDRLGRELPKILESVATVSQALAGAGDVAPMSHPTPLRNVFREDVVRPSLAPEDALAAAPASEDQRFLVPKILGEE
jgi:aspartyl-tRNA(Asn)/glutamyl-tRNA(Gln) amidotransferase subunit C